MTPVKARFLAERVERKYFTDGVTSLSAALADVLKWEVINADGQAAI